MLGTEQEEALAERGWLVLDLPEPRPVFAARESLLAWLRARGCPQLQHLDDYHQLASDEDQHLQLAYGLASHAWEAELGRAIIVANLDLFRRLLGPDLVIQRKPYLRVVRPGTTRDAVPLHRDTYYGASPYEVSILVPFTEMGRASALSVITGSHLAPDTAYPFRQEVSQDVAIRSPRHQLGYHYAPRKLDPGLKQHTQTVPLAVGQVLLFGLSLVHGGGENHGPGTRFSTDIRLANMFAPVAWSRGVHQDYFVPLCTSAVTAMAQRYLQANKEAAEPRVVESA